MRHFGLNYTLNKSALKKFGENQKLLCPAWTRAGWNCCLKAIWNVTWLVLQRAEWCLNVSYLVSDWWINEYKGHLIKRISGVIRIFFFLRGVKFCSKFIIAPFEFNSITVVLLKRVIRCSAKRLSCFRTFAVPSTLTGSRTFLHVCTSGMRP